MNKKSLFTVAVFVLLAAGFTGCKLGGSNDQSPVIGMYSQAILNDRDTINLSYNDDGNIEMDTTLYVNDTVTLYLLCEGFYNNLKQFSFSVTNAADIEAILPDSLKAKFDSSSDFDAGKIIFRENILSMGFPFVFVARTSNPKTKLNFTLESDAEVVSNLASSQLEFAIKTKQNDIEDDTDVLP